MYLFNSLLMWLLIFSSFKLQAQKTFEEVIPLENAHTIEVDAQYADVQINTWDGNAVKVVAVASVNMGQDDDHFNMEVTNNSGRILVESKIDCKNLDRKVILELEDGSTKIVKGKQFDWQSYSDANPGIQSMNMGSDVKAVVKVYVPVNQALEIITVYGDIDLKGDHKNLRVKSTYGDVEAEIANLHRVQNINLISTYGVVDLSLDEQSEALLELSTAYGEVFSDLPLTAQGKVKSNVHSCGGQKGTYSLNEGSKPINIKATYDNIYLRKI